MKSSKSHLKTCQIKDLDAIVKYVSGKAKFDVYEAYSVLGRLAVEFYLDKEEVRDIKFAIELVNQGFGGDDRAIAEVMHVVKDLKRDPSRVRPCPSL